MAICVRKAYERQRNDCEMWLASWCSILRMAADFGGDTISSSDLLIAAKQRVPDGLGDGTASAKIRHLARDILEEKPTFIENRK